MGMHCTCQTLPHQFARPNCALLPVQVESWRKAVAQAQQAVELLARASRLLASLLERHKLQGQKVGSGRSKHVGGLAGKSTSCQASQRVHR